MATEVEMTAYERRRLENIKRNAEMLASLSVHARLFDLAAISKRPRVEGKSTKISEKQKSEVPTSCSLRRQGKPPDGADLPDVSSISVSGRYDLKYKKVSSSVNGPLSMQDAYVGDGLYCAIVEKIGEVFKKSELDSANGGEKLTNRTARGSPSSLSMAKREKLEGSGENLSKLEAQSNSKSDLLGDNGQGMSRMRGRANGVSKSSLESRSVEGVESIDQKSKLGGERGSSTSHVKVERVKLDEPIDLKSLKLESKNVAKVAPERIFSLQFFPTTNMTMVVAGDIFGHVSFWDLKQQSDSGEDAVIHLYQPHSAPVSGISMHPFSLSKMYTSSHDGFLRVMNIEREEFDLAYLSSTGSALTSHSQPPNDAYSIYLGEGEGDLNVIDARGRGTANSWSLHDRRINTIDFNPANPNIMATSSTDGSACLWDLRKINAQHPRNAFLQSVHHKRAVYSAYFSPSGISLATTSSDGEIGLLCGVNFEEKVKVRYNYSDNLCRPFLRASWGWDDTYLFMGNSKRRVDVVSMDVRKVVHALESQLMTSVPRRYCIHPCTPGMLAGATCYGKVYVWTPSP